MRARRCRPSRLGTTTLVASTGPRTCARGDSRRAQRTSHAAPRFNGAAHLRARRYKASRVFVLPSHSFNGAAHLRARRSDEIRTLTRWIRRFNGAAHLRARRSRRARCGRISPRCFNGAAHLRARRFAVRRRPTHRIESFNGAAHLRARRFRSCSILTPLRDAASTGPRTCARGDTEGPNDMDNIDCASTGPRTCACGDSPDAAHGLLLWGMLQRGRALARAEIARRIRKADPDDGFNGAAHLRARRSRDRVPMIRAVEFASTGPRTCARGDCARERQAPSRSDASTGPRTCARGDTDASPPVIARSRSFNGAAHLRARRFGGDLADDRFHRGASTGPRTCARGDGSPS